MDISLILMIAVLLEAFIEYFKSIFELFSTKEYKKGATQIITIISGVLFAFAFGINVFSILEIAVDPIIGTVFTGIIISRGSNYASDLIGKLTK